jgi:hypothetical protein
MRLREARSTRAQYQEDAIVDSTIIHGCMEAGEDWLADLVGHLRSAPGFRRRHSCVLLTAHQPEHVRLISRA